MSNFDADDPRTRIALFRAEIIGHLLRRDMPYGALKSGLEELSEQVFRPPGSDTTREYAFSTLERWYYAYRNGGLEALKPKGRSDQGYGQNLTDEMRELLVDIRRDFPSASVPTILRTLVADGRLDGDAVSASTVRRLFADRGLRRQPADRPGGSHQRLRWEAEAPMRLWHGDVLYGPTIEPEDAPSFETRIHGFLDDASRFVVHLEARRRERERDMLVLLADTLRRYGLPDRLYLDNGSTYTGKRLKHICARLQIGLLHASPGDPQARGKMERFWRTLREGCLDHMGRLESLHDLNVRLRAFLDQHYHYDAHSGLMGRAPREVFAEQNGDDTERISEDRLREVFVERTSRAVRDDSTLEFDGQTWEVDQRFLTSSSVTVCRSLLDSEDDRPWLDVEGRRLQLHPVEPTKNARRRRPDPEASDEDASTSVDFDPAEAYLKRATGQTTDNSDHSNFNGE